MDVPYIVPLLSLGTLFAVLVFAMMGKAAIDRRRQRRNAPKSSLATDGPDNGGPRAKP